MPSLEATAKRRADAINHLDEMMAQLSAHYGVPAVEFKVPHPRYDALVNQMLEVEALETWLASLLPHLLPPEGEPAVDLETLTIAQLKDYAAEHEIDLGDATKKADIVEAIRAAEKPDASEKEPDGEPTGSNQVENPEVTPSGEENKPDASTHQ